MAIGSTSGMSNLSLTIPLVGLENLSGAEKRRFGNSVIRRIKRNLSRGLDAEGNPMKGYSDEYKDSLEFQAFGKSNTPNIRLTGDLWASMTVTEVGVTSLTIGFDDPGEEAKAAGNFLGSYGQDFPNPDNARRFLGLPDDQLEEMKRDFIRTGLTQQQSEAIQEEVGSSTLSFIQGLTNRIFG